MSKILNILCLGDVVGKLGRHILLRELRSLQQENHAHFTVLNVENASGGFGITLKSYKELDSLDVQVFTSGNHVYDKKEIMDQFSQMPKLIRPLNFPKGSPGLGVKICQFNDIKIAVVNIIGRVFMHPSDCPFQKMQSQMETLAKEVQIILVDFHAEATSEKQAMGWFLDGKVACVFGTHTHVQTADERILEKGTAYITDIGMTGASGGILGMERGVIIQKFLTQLPVRFNAMDSGSRVISGIKVSVDAISGRAVSIERIQREYRV